MNDDQDKQLLREIHTALVGDEKLGNEGLVKKVQRHEEWIANAKVRAGMIIGGAMVAGWLADFILKKL